jgi:hypothetical protein
VVNPPSVAAGELPECGRGLLLVAVYADRWGCTRRDDIVKTVWAEVGCGERVEDQWRITSQDRTH